MPRHSAFNITGVLAVLLAAGGASASDLVLAPKPMEDADVDLLLPAVSGPNGKWEFYLGPSSPGGFTARAAGSVSLPVGDRYGVQFDGAVSGSSGGGWLIGGVAHGFTRDPENYLLGIATGLVRGPTGTLGVIGVEGEAYIDNFSFEGWAGLAAINYDVLPDVAGLMALGDAAYYVNDDLRLSVGVQHLIGVNGLHLGAEYQLTEWNLPMSVAADTRFNSDGSWSIMTGIKGYFGGEEKSLKDRHRQDDPANRVLSLFTASGNLLYKTAAAGGACSPSFSSEPFVQCVDDYAEGEAFCIANGYDDYDIGDGECVSGT